MPVNKVPFRVKSNKQLVPKSAENLRIQVPKVAKSRMLAAARDLKNRMAKAGKKVKYPIDWDSVRQKIGVIIYLRKHGGLPYKRKRKIEKGWKVVPLKTGYSVENRVKGSKYVYGDLKGQRQSSIHKNRWPELVVQTDIVLKALPQGMQKAMKELVDKVATQKESVK